jgi:hypothetical protein
VKLGSRSMKTKSFESAHTETPSKQNTVDTGAKLAFDLAYSNLQSISRAQRLYLTALLLYLCLVWGWFFVGNREAVSLQLLGVMLRTEGFWTITPLVTTLLTLALIGSINAAGPVWKRLREAFSKVGIPAPECSVVFYQLDTDKNIFDYFTFLKLHPEKLPREERRARFDLWHFLYPSLFAASIYTNYRAWMEAYGIGEAWHHLGFQTYALVCLFLQTAYAVRPFYRATCRFLGIRIHLVND